ncbi:MAG: hypothetical protein IIW51_08010, partial [Peptococcaceae bacterium]|nr:hypothetical protein [Peptococcaceae bacterium]
MKLQKMIYGLVCLFVALMLCGCEWELASPESLITPPKSNQERLQQKQLVTSFLSREESLIVPEALNEANAYQYLDLDQNGDDEIIAFYANKESNFMLGFVILDQSEKQWYLKHKAVAYGTDVHFFAAKDLDDDGQLEILLGVDTGYGSQKELYLYQMNEQELTDITGEERITYDQITLAKNEKNGSVLVTARMDTSVLEGNSNITVYEYYHGNVMPVYDETFTGYCSEMRFDKVARNADGVYLAMRHNHFVNVLLLKETAEGFAVVMEHPLPYDYEDVSNVQIFHDENNDGVVEIISLWSPELNDSTRGYKDYIQVWLQWDGMEGLIAVDAVLENVSEGYRFSVPLEWMDWLYYDFRTQDTVIWTDFYSENGNMEFETVFSFAAIDQLVWDNMEQTDDMVVLGNNPTKNKIYVAEIRKEEFNGFRVNAGRLNACLQIEGGERK